VNQLRIELLGRFRVSVGERAVADAVWYRRKPAALVKLLALAPTHRLHREAIMEALWPEFHPGAASANLRKALHYARRGIADVAPDGAELIASDGEFLTLAADRLWLDVERFRSALAAARRGGLPEAYRQALDLYREGLLPEDRFEEWAIGPREELHREFLAALEELARLLEARGDLAEAIGVIRRLVAADPLREEGHAALIRLFVLAGRRTEALRQYEYLARLLERELGTEPSLETQRLAEEIKTRQEHEPALTADLWEHVGDLRAVAGDAVGAAKAFALARDAGIAQGAAARLERKCADVWLMRHQPDVAAPHIAAAEALASDPAERGRLLRARAHHAWETGQIAPAQRYAELARDLAERHGTPDDLAAAYEALAAVSHIKGEWRQGLESELQRLVAADSGPAQLARVYDIHQCISQYHLYGDGLADSVEEYTRRLVDRAEQAGAIRAQAFAWCLLGESLLLRARWDESTGCLSRSCDLHASLDYRSGALPWQRRAELAVCRGDFDEANACLREASAMATVSAMAGHLWGRIHATATFAAIEQGDAARAVRSVADGEAAVARYGDCPTCSALLNPVAAEAFALVADADSARVYAAAAARVAGMFASSAWRAMAESAAGSVAIAEGDWSAAKDRFATAHDLYERAGQTYWAQRSLRLAALAPA
jgi:DNA-binding SARP family transcriptional activator